MIYAVVVLSILLALSVALNSTQSVGMNHIMKWLRSVQDQLSAALAERLHAEERHTEIEKDLREQVQSLAQQLATLRVTENAVPDQDRFEPVPEPPKPYSQELTQFLLGIENSDARLMVEEDIERNRAQGTDDEQIFTIISEG